MVSNKIEYAYCDGDVWAYRLGFSCGDNPWFTVLWAYEDTLDKVQKKYPDAKIVVCLTDEKENFRKGVAKTRPYKGGRVSSKPKWWRDLRNHMYEQDNVLLSVNEEADDVMSKALVEYGDKAVCVTIDKDLKNTYGLHYNDFTGVEVRVNQSQAYVNFYTQLLVGDTVDNIQGLKGWGVVKASKLLDGCMSPMEYERRIGLAYACSPYIDDPEARMIEMGQLLWMRRVDNEMWNLRVNGFKTEEGL